MPYAPVEDQAEQHAIQQLEPVKRLTRDLAASSANMTADEARYLVDYYYICQEDRKRSSNQEASLDRSNEPNAVIGWLAQQSTTLENQIKRALGVYTDNHPVGGWMKSIYGIGPVIAAGLLAHIDIEQAPTAGHIWRFAGLDPNVKWMSSVDCTKWVSEQTLPLDQLYEVAALHFGRNVDTLKRYAETDAKGNPQKLTKSSFAKSLARRPWNNNLKTLCWKVGQSFMKFSNAEECLYGHIYKERKAYENARNDNGTNRELALKLAEKVGKTTEAFVHYSAGKLPPGQIDARARRYAVKLFLSHLQMVWYKIHYGKDAPLPYPIAILGHAHMIQPPNMPK